MPSFDIVKRSEIDRTFRVAEVIDSFDIDLDKADSHFSGEIPIDFEWSIGVIVGGSGTGKSTIARHIFGDQLIRGFEYSAKSVIDDMPKGIPFSEISRMFFSVGFGSIPSWLRPYSVLSTGEKMRVDIARAIMEKDFIVFDEFTSVVDRDVARTACIAISKAIRRSGKKFVAVSCHYDILDYIEADWVFDTSKMKFDRLEGRRRKKIEFTVRKCGIEEWKKFSRYHYLSAEILRMAGCFGLYHGENQVGFCAVVHFPHPRNYRIKRIHRIVILPDYQGVGLGVKLCNIVAESFIRDGFDIRLVTSAKNFAKALVSTPEWKCEFAGIRKPSKTKNTSCAGFVGAQRRVNTYSFKFIGNKSDNKCPQIQESDTAPCL